MQRDVLKKVLCTECIKFEACLNSYSALPSGLTHCQGFKMNTVEGILKVQEMLLENRISNKSW
jgi:hypothetical protein